MNRKAKLRKDKALAVYLAQKRWNSDYDMMRDEFFKSGNTHSEFVSLPEYLKETLFAQYSAECMLDYMIPTALEFIKKNPRIRNHKVWRES